MHSESFKQYLTEGDLEGLMTVPKSDLHNHASNGGNPGYIEKLAGIKINPFSGRFNSVGEMEAWAHKEIKIHCTKLQRWEAAFAQAAGDNISVLAMSFGRDELDCHGRFQTIAGFISCITELKDKYLPGSIFMPELAFHMEMDIDYEMSIIDEIFSYDFFKSVDIWATSEPADEYRKFKPLYKKAGQKRLRLKAHAGEFNGAEDVMEAAEELELNEIHHGTAASGSAQIMKWLAKNNIQLNICPTSNVLLSRAGSYKDHPIRALYDAGVPVTVNTDDMLIFNQSVSQEYLNLYQCGLMNADELDKIRTTGLSDIK